MDYEYIEQSHLLNERKKELRCLYSLSRIIDRNATIEDTCANIVELIPDAWQYCEIAYARITLNGADFTTRNFVETVWRQSSPIRERDAVIGSIDVCYLQEMPPSDEGPFHREERELLDAITERIGKAVEHKHAEEELRRTKEYLENLLDYANAPIIVWDAGSQISIFNHAFERLTGWPSNAVIGKPLHMLFPPDSLSQTMDLIGRAMTGEHWETVDIPILCADGRVRTVLWNSASIRDPRNGACIATIAQGQDITDRKQAENAVRESEHRFRLIAENVNDGFSIYDVDNGTHAYVNKVFRDITCMPELPLSEILGALIRMVHPDDRSKVSEIYHSKVDGVLEYRITRPDGRLRWLRRRSFPVRDTSGRMKYVVGVTTDITEAKNVEVTSELHRRELIQADKMVSLGRIVSGVAHEINNPNNFIMLNAPLLRQAWESALPVLRSRGEELGRARIGKMPLDEFTEYVFPLIDGILDGSRRIARIVTDLKDYARPDACDVNGHTDLPHVVRSAVNLLRNTLTKKAVDLNLSIGEAPVMIQGSFQRLEQVVINLLQNSCDAISGEGERSISVLLDDTSQECVSLCIRDTGCGIATHEIPHITEPFFTTKRDGGGTGLGLSVSSKIVADHGGQLLFESEVGKGTSAQLILPRKRAQHVQPQS